ncbi:MAG TPA: hypothetical protein VFO01_02180 [Trebonia sp.]|nr:hypothetical protein [Trebonia sp.]
MPPGDFPDAAGHVGEPLLSGLAADYRDSTEELTPAWSLPVVAATLATLVSPPAWRHFADAPRAYSLTPAAWRQLLDRAEKDGQPQPSPRVREDDL